MERIGAHYNKELLEEVIFLHKKKKKLKYGIISDGLLTAAAAVAEARVKSRRNLKAHRLSSTFYNLCPVYVRAR